MGRKTKAWLSRQRDGNYMLTLFRPHFTRIRGTDKEDFYIQHGEPLGVRYLCPGGIMTLFGVDIPIGTCTRVYVYGEEICKSLESGDNKPK